jgi:hypothetical protein
MSLRSRGSFGTLPDKHNGSLLASDSGDTDR